MDLSCRFVAVPRQATPFSPLNNSAETVAPRRHFAGASGPSKAPQTVTVAQVASPARWIVAAWPGAGDGDSCVAASSADGDNANDDDATDTHPQERDDGDGADDDGGGDYGQQRLNGSNERWCAGSLRKE